MSTLFQLPDETYDILKVAEQRIVAPGTYRYSVKSADFSIAEATENRPSCQQLTVVLSLIPLSGDDQGKTFTDRLYFTKKLMWKASEFFESMGGIDTVLSDGRSIQTEKIVAKVGLCEVSKKFTGTSSQNQRAWTEVAYKPYGLYKAYSSIDSDKLPATIDELEKMFGEITAKPND